MPSLTQLKTQIPNNQSHSNIAISIFLYNSLIYSILNNFDNFKFNDST